MQIEDIMVLAVTALLVFGVVIAVVRSRRQKPPTEPRKHGPRTGSATHDDITLFQIGKAGAEREFGGR